MQPLTVTKLSALVFAAALALCSAKTNASSSLVDCSQFQQTATVDSLQVRFTSILDNHVGPNGYLHAEVTFPGQGWIGFGYSPYMVPGYSVIGLPGVANSATNPGKYSMQGLVVGVGGVALMDNSMQTLTNATVSSNATHTFMTFTKRLIESGGETPISGDGSNTFLLAYGATTDSLSYHIYRTTFVYNLRSCVNGVAATASSSNGAVMIVGQSMEKQLWTAHGVFAAIAWGVLAPVAIASSILRRIFIASDLPALWFKIHQTVNMTVFIFTVLSFAFAVRATGLEHKEHFKGVQHRTTGLFIMILVFLQVMMGICRPHLPHKPEQEEVSLEEDGFGRTDEPAKEELVPKKSIQRILWETLHRLLGFTLLGFAWWQVGNGLGLYSEYFSEKNLANVFWGITGTLSAITLVVYFLLFIGCA